MEENIRFPKVTYIRDENKFPIACLAYSQINSNTLRYAISIFNPTDSFKKSVGYDLAVGRFFTRSSTFGVASTVGKVPLAVLLNSLMSYLSDNPDKSKRLRSAAINYLKHSREKEKVRAAKMLGDDLLAGFPAMLGSDMR